MENNTQPVTAQELPNAAMHPRTGFPSEEAMKAYYLQLIDIMNITYAEEPSEYISLQCLKRKLRQFIHVLRLIGTHEWGNGIAEIQDASGIYMLQSTLPHKTLLQANREIGLHLQFITQLASNVGFLKQLEGILHYHFQNVESLLNKLKENRQIPCKIIKERGGKLYGFTPRSSTRKHSILKDSSYFLYII